MIVQVVVVVLVCVVASLFALTIAGVSLSVFGKLLKRTGEADQD
jgi:hypothetical protein